ncbi:methyltransferase domain-containing protein [Dictyobacter formicarum]|uniref:Protein-L-isoaspartate O-methyltransferase n=1 Tax=Dictyobacter formicarum TaxID=2778368 RepID=A0ABQ3VQR5_9CHLR|nr:methyltransferase domain-containing protein [Dictyobacter formicarum]GHO88207.1 protein-L-isoaspartate O-methyltransferase [Dictyobacter formicarum]
MDQAPVPVLQDQLVRAIQAEDVQQADILNAFRRVPRHAFVPVFFDRVTPNAREWRMVSSDQAEWLQKVYTNQPLTISIDQDGYPDSSSSHPGLMARMLQSVQLHPGSRVLEIGTGTGYNAALVAALVGTTNVITVDINAALLDAARARIERIVGPGVRVLHADGRNLPANLGLFDALIVTGAHERVEPSWINALAPGGRIIFNWAQGLIKVMLEAEKVGDTLVGRVCEYGGEFMFLHAGNGVKRTLLPCTPLELVEATAFQSQIFDDPDFSFFLQIHIPLAYSLWRKSTGAKVYVVEEQEHHRMLQFFPEKIRGDRSLWEEIQTLYAQFDNLARPKYTTFTFSCTLEGHMTFALDRATLQHSPL